jgi:hypothetical protein
MHFSIKKIYSYPFEKDHVLDTYKKELSQKNSWHPIS